MNLHNHWLGIFFSLIKLETVLYIEPRQQDRSGLPSTLSLKSFGGGNYCVVVMTAFFQDTSMILLGCEVMSDLV